MTDRPQPLSPRAWAVALGLVLLSFLTFLPVLRCGFTDFDDPSYVTNNRHVLDGLNSADIHWALTNTSVAYWQPLSWLSLMLDTTLNGPGAFGYHRTNLLLHALSAGVAFLVLYRMTGAFWRAALIAALYAVHPLRIESVAWVAERKDVLSNLLAWLTIGGYVRYSRSPSARRYLLVLIPFALGLLAKPMIVTLPCLLLLLDYWPLRRWAGISNPDVNDNANAHGPLFAVRPLKWLLLEKLPLLLLSLAAAASAFIAQAKCSALIPLARYALSWRIGNAVIAYSLYLWKMVWFADLCAFYPLPRAWDAGHFTQLGVAIAVLLAITIVALVNYRRRPWLVVGWLWFLGVLAPVCGIFQAGPQLLADRFSYLPSVGLVVMVVFSIPAAISTAAQLRLRIGLTVVMLAIFCSGSWLQSRYWLSTFTLFSRAQEVTKDNWLAYDQLGLVAYRNGNMDLAEGYCRRSLRLNEIDPVANYNLGIALARKGQFKSAIPFYQASMVLQPDSPEAHVMLGVALEQTGDLQGAYANYERATEIAPEYASAHGAMGVILARIGLSDKAVAELRTALKLQPSDEKLRAKYFAAVAMAKQKSQPSVAGAAEAGQ